MEWWSEGLARPGFASSLLSDFGNKISRLYPEFASIKRDL